MDRPVTNLQGTGGNGYARILEQIVWFINGLRSAEPRRHIHLEVLCATSCRTRAVISGG